MLVLTIEYIPNGKIIECFGLVQGLVVSTPTITQGFLGGFKSFVGGNNNSYTQASENTKKIAFEKMLQNAKELGANAIIGLKIDNSGYSNENSTINETVCYGTAVFYKKNT